MTKRIFRSICFVALAVFLASLVFIMSILYGYFSQMQQTQLKTQLELAAQGVSHEGTAYFREIAVKDCRITWIDETGNVLYDSEAQSADMENHLEREEIIQALSEGYGESKRYSQTLMYRSLYAAKRLEDGTVLRLSISQNSVLILLLGMAQPICIVFLIAIALSVFLAVRLSKSIVRPLNEIDLDHPLGGSSYDELAPLLRRIDSQQRQLQARKRELEQKQNELGAITGSMREGMILLNRQGKIVSINPAARKLLQVEGDPVGADLLTLSRILELQELLAGALEGRQMERTVSLGTGRYRIDASPVLSQGETAGAAFCFFDVTEKEKAEQLRREFTANVSHELKTPLHSISGYAELLQNGMVKDEDKVPFAGRIYEEAQRMIRLVEDIISLSRLDEGAEEMRPETVDLYALAEKALDSLEPAARRAGVELELSGEHVSLQGVPRLLYSIVYNLCDNAVKYNHPEGKVSVSVQEENGGAVLSVSDTGIGIPEDQQERVFERFYRVDKSRSKEVGGTGLGLSIVKHAAAIHHAGLELDSTVGQGTTIRVKLPRS